MNPELAALAAPTPPNEIRQRQGPGGKVLDYVDARWVMERLDSTIGPADWQDQYVDLPSGSVRCGIGIKVDDEWVWKWDIGDPSDIESTKGAYSDAFKRAAVKWGIGRDLYGDHARPQTAPRAPVAARSASPAPQRESATMTRPVALPSAPVAAPDIDEDGWQGLIGGTAPNNGAVAVAGPRTGTPMCSVHSKEMKQNKRGWYCPTKVGDGWCEVTA